MFQRGLTRRECIENWSSRRAPFLAQLRKTQSLPELLDFCTQHTSSTNIVVLYSLFSLDSFFVLPYVMETFKEARHITIRYFGYEYFFPFLHGYFERQFPRILILDSDKCVAGSWGPRISETDSNMTWDDETLSQFAIMNYPDQLDLSLVEFFKKYVSSAD